MTSKKAQAELQAKLAAVEVARDNGRDYFKQEPDQMLVTIARYAAMAYGNDTHLQIAFLQGYVEGRSKHDAFKRGE